MNRDDYDSPWKEILSTYFQEFMEFFFPKIAREIDWTRGYELLDKELRQITRESEVGQRLADHLVKVWTNDGEEARVLVHVEVQAREEKGFGRRVFIYHYRIFDLYQRPVVSLAVLADDNPKWYIGEYEQSFWGCGNTFRFPAVKLLEYKDQRAFLALSANTFAVVVIAHLQTLETRKDRQKRFRYKLALTKALYRRGWDRQKIIDLYRFIDWIMALPKKLEKSYHEELVKFEEEIKMPYVTTAERIGMEKGVAQGIEKGVAQGIEKGRLIGEILMAQRVLKQGRYTQESLKKKTEDELRVIHRQMVEMLGTK